MDKRNRIGSEHPLYSGGKTLDASGYVILCSKIWGDNCGRREHRVVMESHIGRKLTSDEVVHHIDGNKINNDISNLRIETRASHNREHGLGSNLTCTTCGKRKWYSPSGMAKLSNLNNYQCKQCSAGRNHTRTCGKCSSAYLGGKNSRYCEKCVRKNNAR